MQRALLGEGQGVGLEVQIAAMDGRSSVSIPYWKVLHALAVRGWSRKEEPHCVFEKRAFSRGD